MIDGVKVTPLRAIPDERGRLMEMFRSDDPDFEKFGQVYLTSAYPGAVKAWHYHKKQTDNFVCVRGMMKVVLYDPREGSPTRGQVNEFFLGDWNTVRLRIPAGVYHGFKCISASEAVIINVPTEPYNRKEPDEYRLPAHSPEIPYDWSRQDK
ncbi:MAG: dTDP-4-dehydrorhamnose 3,5-epimerase [Planctomycetes bacterium]|nr:dTDP-4-dehydrorhamnose 3,5-epimerase [Planctomycetota bacterium]